MSTPSPSSKPAIPRGLVAVVAALVVAIAVVLLLVLTGDDDSVAAEPGGTALPGVRTATDLSRNHTSPTDGGPVAYPDRDTRPPLGGNHAAVWQSCQAYSAPIPPEHAVHSLEHGAVWVTYRRDLPADQVAALAALADGQSHVLVSPYPGQASPVVLTAWGRQQELASASDPQVKAFLDRYVEGPQTPEPGATCESPLTLTGTAPFVTTDGRTFTPSPEQTPVSASGTIG